MLNLKTIEDINKYYVDKKIKPYWTLFEDKYLLKLYHIVEITKVFDELISLYPDIKINGVGDFYTYEKYLYKNYKYKDDPYIKEPTYDKDMFGNYYDFMVGGRYSEENEIIIINHNSLMVMCNNLKKICETLIHEFYHALDDRYGIYKNTRFKEFYKEYCESEEFDDRQLKEFGAREFTKSYLSNTNNKDDKIIRIINSII